jgi:hypothetical protein
VRKAEIAIMVRTVLLIVLILLLIGAVPLWPYSSGWGYYPSGGLGALLVIIVILIFAGVL